MKRKMKFFAALLACAMTISPIAAMAGQWVPMGSDWAYMTDDGDFAKNCWLWLDENHDQKAELYHFDANGMMSKQTMLTLNGDGETLCVNIDENGIANFYAYCAGASWYTSDMISPVLMPAYAIYMANGQYCYYLPDGVPYYNFAEVKDSYISELTDYGPCYAADAFIPIYHQGSAPGVWEPIECGIITNARFAKNCLVTVSYYVGPGDNYDDVMSISDFLARHIDYNYMSVSATDANGYVTACTMMAVE